MIDTAQIIHLMSSLIAVIILIVICTFAIKKFTNLSGKRQSNLKIVSTLALSTKEKLCVIEVGDQQLLLGVTHSQINTLHVLPDKLSRDHQPSLKLSETTT